MSAAIASSDKVFPLQYDPRSEAKYSWLLLMRSLVPLVVVIVPAFCLSFVSTMHRGLTSWDAPRTTRRRTWGILLRLAAVLALLDVLLWPASAIAGTGGALALGMGSSGEGVLVAWCLCWLVTRVLLGAPESCALHRDCGWKTAISRSRARGPGGWRIAIPHVVVIVGAMALSFLPGLASESDYLIVGLPILQAAVSFDAAASAAWYRLTSQESSGDELARTFE